MWGQGLPFVPVDAFQRIIPTRVGTSKKSNIIALLGKDHPHACGDKIGELKELPYMLGSSPRVWGQVKDVLVSA